VPVVPDTRPSVTRERVLRTAVAIADQQGLEALSMRALGTALGVQAMSLYNHVANKDEILDGIVDVVVAEIEIPSADEPWRTAMEKRATSAHAVLMRHPWACGLLMSRVNVGPGMLRYIDATIACLRAAGFSLATADHAWNALDSYIYGFTLHKLQFPFEPRQYAAIAASYLPSLSRDRYPAMHALTEAVANRQHDGLHELGFGLTLLLDGLERMRGAASGR
jgi:AcrR family transcriptional regulator